VELVRGVAVCLRSCGRGCPEGFSCTERTTVEGEPSAQCVPGDNQCPKSRGSSFL